MSQFNFYQRSKPKDINAGMERAPCKNPKEIRDRILEQYDLFMNMSNSDDTFKKLKNNRDLASDDFMASFSQLKKEGAEWSADEIKDLNDRMNRYDDLYKEANRLYELYVADRLAWLKSEYPSIYVRIIDETAPIIRETLEHVLEKFCKFENKEIAEKDAVLSGLEHMKKRHNLPEDFFDTSKIDQFIKSISRQ